jgi:hypothetical protein
VIETGETSPDQVADSILDRWGPWA